MQPSGPHLIVQPDDGLEPVRQFISSAQTSLFLKQFTFTDETLVRAVVERKLAGVNVRVMLNAARSGGDRANDETYEQFRSVGIDVQWANPKFYVTHEKSIVVDEKAALVATFNLCEKYFTRTRDYGVITHDSRDVAQIVEVFEPTGTTSTGSRPIAMDCCGAIPTHVCTWPSSSTAPRVGSTSSTPSSSTPLSSTASSTPHTAG